MQDPHPAEAHDGAQDGVDDAGGGEPAERRRQAPGLGAVDDGRDEGE